MSLLVDRVRVYAGVDVSHELERLARGNLVQHEVFLFRIRHDI